MSKKKTRSSDFKLAVGLSYDGNGTPTVSSKGMHINADTIVRIARRYGVPIVEQPSLANILSSMELEEEIPTELFEAVAVVINELESAID